MSRRLRRLPALLLPLALVATLAACGDDDSGGDDSGSDALHGITISGEVGKAPEVKWDGKLEVEDTETTVVEEGDGDVVAEGDQVVANVWIGNGYSQEEAYSTYAEGGSPENFTASNDLSPVFRDAILDHPVGSRVAVTTTGTEAFGEGGNSQMGIAPSDSVLVVVDIMDVVVVLDGPEGAEQEAPAWAPELVTDGDKITGLDFAGTPEPNGKLRSATLIEGEGEKVKKGQTITVNYLGQVYDAKEPFDESYSREPASFAIGVGQVVAGWDKTLVGATIGSRLILAIPPADGYGDQGNPQAGIKGTDTLYFVVDILAAS